MSDTAYYIMGEMIVTMKITSKILFQGVKYQDRNLKRYGRQ